MNGPTLIGISGEVIQTNLKRSLLLYDKIGLLNLKMSMNFAHMYGRENSNFLNKNKEAAMNITMLEMLVDKEVLFEVNSAKISIPKMVAQGNREELWDFVSKFDDVKSDIEVDREAIRIFVEKSSITPRDHHNATNNVNRILSHYDRYFSLWCRMCAPSFDEQFHAKVHALNCQPLELNTAHVTNEHVLNVVLSLIHI